MRRLHSNVTQVFLILPLLVCSELVASSYNIAPASRVTSSPFVGANIEYLTDGIIDEHPEGSLMMAAPLPIINHSIMPVSYTFTLPSVYKVNGVTIYQFKSIGRRPAKKYIFEADTNNDGNFDKVIASEKAGEGGKWFRYTFALPVSTQKIRFTTKGYSTEKGPNYGGTAVAEIEILTDEAPPATADILQPNLPSLTQIDETRVTWGDKFDDKLEITKNGFMKGTFASMWLFWSLNRPYNARQTLESVQLLNRLGLNTLWLYPGVYADSLQFSPSITRPNNKLYRHYTDNQDNLSKIINGKMRQRIAPFPSQIALGYRENILSQFITHMHDNDITVIINEKPVPFGTKSWGFPNVSEPYAYPCLLSSNFMHDASIQYYREFIQSGADGLALGGDEFFVYNHTGLHERKAFVCNTENSEISSLCTPTCRTLYRDKYGAKPPSSRKSLSHKNPLWELFEYNQLANLTSDYAKMMRKENPDSIITSLFRSGEQNRANYGVAYDIMGYQGGIDVMSSNPYWNHNNYQGHYFFANETKKLIGASKKGRASITLQSTPKFNVNGYKDPLMLYGPAFSALMHGAHGVSFYKLDYLYADGKNDAGQWVKKYFSMVNFLEKKGLLDYTAPKNIALIFSRASEDWWQLRYWYKPKQSAQAILYQNFIMDVLFSA